MRWVGALILCGALVQGHNALAAEDSVSRNALPGKKADLPAGVSEGTFSPPPVPRFMLEKSTQPLSMDQMIRQAREVESRANMNRASPGQDLDVTKPNANR